MTENTKQIFRLPIRTEKCPLLSLAIKNYITTIKSEDKSPDTVFIYSYNLKIFQGFIGDMPLSQILPIHIREYMIHRKQGMSSSTLNQAYRVLRTFFNWCVNERYIQTQDYPLFNIKSPRIEHKVIPIYTRDEIKKLMTFKNHNPFLAARNRAIIAVLLDTGIRRAELTGIKLSDLNLNRGAIQVKGKGNKERIVPIGTKGKEMLLEYMVIRNSKKPQNDYLFLADDLKPLGDTGLSTVIRKLCLSTGVKVYKVVHKFRHSFAIETLRNNGRIDVLKYTLGHTSIDTTMNYLTAINDDDARLDHMKSSPGDKWL